MAAADPAAPSLSRRRKPTGAEGLAAGSYGVASPPKAGAKSALTYIVALYARARIIKILRREFISKPKFLCHASYHLNADMCSNCTCRAGL
jgi:hypothetical protein